MRILVTWGGNPTSNAPTDRTPPDPTQNIQSLAQRLRTHVEFALPPAMQALGSDIPQDVTFGNTDPPPEDPVAILHRLRDQTIDIISATQRDAQTKILAGQQQINDLIKLAEGTITKANEAAKAHTEYYDKLRDASDKLLNESMEVVNVKRDVTAHWEQVKGNIENTLKSLPDEEKVRGWIIEEYSHLPSDKDTIAEAAAIAVKEALVDHPIRQEMMLANSECLAKHKSELEGIQTTILESLVAGKEKIISEINASIGSKCGDTGSIQSLRPRSTTAAPRGFTSSSTQDVRVQHQVRVDTAVENVDTSPPRNKDPPGTPVYITPSLPSRYSLHDNNNSGNNGNNMGGEFANMSNTHTSPRVSHNQGARSSHGHFNTHSDHANSPGETPNVGSRSNRDGSSSGSFGDNSSNTRSRTAPVQSPYRQKAGEDRITTSRTDAQVLATVPNDVQDWHGALSDNVMDGTLPLSERALSKLGIPQDHHFTIIESHELLMVNWSKITTNDDGTTITTSTSSSARSGPRESYALTYTSWPDLTALTSDCFADFYRSLRRHLMQFNMVLMPLEGIVLTYAEHTLCIPGTGLRKYQRMGSSLFLLLDKVLPKQFSYVSEQVNSVASGSANGYLLLWRLAKFCCPQLDITKNVEWPIWPQDGGIFIFAKKVNLHAALARHRGTIYSDREKSLMFLSGCQGTYATQAKNLKIMVRAFQFDATSRHADPSEKSLKLPSDLQVHQLAQQLYEDNGGVLSEMGLSSSNQRINTTQQQHSDQVMDDVGQDDISMDVDSLIDMLSNHIQGYDYVLLCNKFTRGGNNRRPPPRGTGVRFSEPNVGQSNRRNDKNTTKTSFGRRPKFNGICDACGKRNHPASRCDQLGMAACLRRYMQEGKNQATIDAAEQQWIERNKRFLQARGDDASRTPRQVMVNYCNDLHFDEEQVIDELDWEHFYEDPTDADHA